MNRLALAAALLASSAPLAAETHRVDPAQGAAALQEALILAAPGDVIELRTAPQAEEEIRLVFNRIGEIMKAEAPALFGDYEIVDGAWIPGWRKV